MKQGSNASALACNTEVTEQKATPVESGKCNPVKECMGDHDTGGAGSPLFPDTPSHRAQVEVEKNVPARAPRGHRRSAPTAGGRARAAPVQRPRRAAARRPCTPRTGSGAPDAPPGESRPRCRGGEPRRPAGRQATLQSRGPARPRCAPAPPRPARPGPPPRARRPHSPLSLARRRARERGPCGCRMPSGPSATRRPGSGSGRARAAAEDEAGGPLGGLCAAPAAPGKFGGARGGPAPPRPGRPSVPTRERPPPASAERRLVPGSRPRERPPARPPAALLAPPQPPPTPPGDVCLQRLRVRAPGSPPGHMPALKLAAQSHPGVHAVPGGPDVHDFPGLEPFLGTFLLQQGNKMKLKKKKKTLKSSRKRLLKLLG
ncbi:unnamed protein product [Nyctereutes procyonoides]|uniref:(raccoon dog) hypothetical protein n=1 Tax=Nyctereutes procyonoides TaxID=34880 RepID=A0A811Z2V5_NYCPR|nr:unnamed protein product [Nyctereutes procyonoides]